MRWCFMLPNAEVPLSLSFSRVSDLGPPPPQVVHHQHHHHHLPRSLLLQHLRPVSNMDSGLYSTSDSEQEDSAKTTPAEGKTKTTEGKKNGLQPSNSQFTLILNLPSAAGSDEEDVPLPAMPPAAASPRPTDGLPPRPPKAAESAKVQRGSSAQQPPLPPPSPSSPSSSSGHHSAASSKVTPSPQQQLLLNVSASSSGAPSSASPASSGSPGGEMITKLRKEVEQLKSKFLDSQRHWHEVSLDKEVFDHLFKADIFQGISTVLFGACKVHELKNINIFPQERNILLDEIIRRHSHHDNVVEDLSTDVQVLEAQRVRLTLLEEKIKEVLSMLRSLNSMVNCR